MKALIVVAALAAVLLIGCDSNVTGPATFPAVSQSSARTLPISAVIERLDANGAKRVIEVTGMLEYSVVEPMPVEIVPGETAPIFRSYVVTMTFRANLKDKVSLESWKAAGFSTDRLDFTAACRKYFTKNYAIEGTGSNLNMEFEVLNDNLALSQIWITL